MWYSVSRLQTECRVMEGTFLQYIGVLHSGQEQKRMASAALLPSRVTWLALKVARSFESLTLIRNVDVWWRVAEDVRMEMETNWRQILDWWETVVFNQIQWVPWARRTGCVSVSKGHSLSVPWSPPSRVGYRNWVTTGTDVLFLDADFCVLYQICQWLELFSTYFTFGMIQFNSMLFL